MKRALAVTGLLGLAVLVSAARPGTELQLDTQLSGQNTRWTLADGGKSGIFTQVPDGGALNPSCGCVLINNAKTPTNLPILPDGGISPLPDGGAPAPVYNSISANVLYLQSLAGPINYCLRPSAMSPVWDGGCNVSVLDENYGTPWPNNTVLRLVPDSKATTLCACSDAGYLQLPAWTAQ